MSWELTLPPPPPVRNRATGRFLPGSTPHNKGKRWDEYMTKRQQRKSAKGWKNVITHRPKHRPDTSGRCRKQVMAILDDGRSIRFAYLGDAAEWIGGNRENVGRCCRYNQANHINLKTGKINTDHRYKGVRFYFLTDDNWWDKIDN